MANPTSRRGSANDSHGKKMQPCTKIAAVQYVSSTTVILQQRNNRFHIKAASFSFHLRVFEPCEVKIV